MTLVFFRSGYPYLYTATNDTPDGFSVRDPFVIFLWRTFFET